MMNGIQLGVRWFGNADIQFTIALAGIGRDDVGLLLLSQPDRGRRFSDSRRANNYYNGGWLQTLDDFVGGALFTSLFTFFPRVSFFFFSFNAKSFGPLGEIVFFFHFGQLVADQSFGTVL